VRLRLSLFLCALIPSAFAPGAVTIETRGQAELVARRHAIDAATADLRVQADALRVTPRENLGDWVATRPQMRTAVDQVLRDAQVTENEARGGEWHVTLAVTVGEINEALRSSLRRGLAEDADQTLTAHGSAPIRWASGQTETPRRPAPANLPPEAPSGGPFSAPPQYSRQGVPQ
jgi:hypothetical protein